MLTKGGDEGSKDRCVTGRGRGVMGSLGRMRWTGIQGVAGCVTVCFENLI